MHFSVLQQDGIKLDLLSFLELTRCVVLVLTSWASTSSALRLAIELLHTRPRPVQVMRKSIRLVDKIVLLFPVFLQSGEKIFLFPPWLVAPRTLSILFVVWTVMQTG